MKIDDKKLVADDQPLMEELESSPWYSTLAG